MEASSKLDAPWRPGASGRRLVVVFILGMTFVVGCGSYEEFHDPKVTNATNHTIQLYFVSNGIEVPVGSVAAGSTGGLSFADGKCTHGTLIARDASGQEIARRSEPLCADEFWNVGSPAPSG
jgi:hypothetical protein